MRELSRQCPNRMVWCRAMFSTTRFVITASLTISTALAVACGQSTTNSISPSGLGGRGDAAADGSTLKVTAPTLISPVGGVEVTDHDPDVVFGRSSALHLSGASPEFQYELEVYDEDGQRVYVRTLGATGDTTSHELQTDLDFNEVHTWRVRARLGEHAGPWSTLASFRTFEDAMAANSCAHIGDPLGIVQCRRAQFGNINDEDLPEFLALIAFDLNRANVPGGPWGILQKATGTNCEGYSCDIICSGQGDDQNQFDVLGDAEGDAIPGWREIDEDLVPRFCEYIQ